MANANASMKSSLNKKIFPLILLLPLIAAAASDDQSPLDPENATTVEQTEETSANTPEKGSKHCESEVDRQICNTVNEALASYYQISNHMPSGYYERIYSMRNLTDSIEATRQSAINEFGHPDSMDMYTAFIDFVKFKEKTEILFNRQEYDEADFNREMAFKNHDKIIEYCKTCVDVLK